MNAIKKFLKQNYKLLLFMFALLVANIFFLVFSFQDNQISLYGKKFLFTAIGSISISISLCVFLFFAKQRQWKIENIYLVVGGILGLFYLVVIPLGSAPDECAHFLRAYGIVEGCLESQVDSEGNAGCEVPSSIYCTVGGQYSGGLYTKMVEDLDRYPDADKSFMPTTASSYSIINYLPQCLGIITGKIFNLPILVGAYLGRLFGLIFCVAIIYLCLKKIPFLKDFLLLIACFPLTIQGFISYSADGSILCGAIALITFVLYMIYDYKEKIKSWHYLLILLLCLVISLTKIVYAPLCFLLFLIPKERFGNLKKKNVSIIIVGLITICVLAIHILCFSASNNATDTTQQLDFIFNHPLSFMIILFKNIFADPLAFGGRTPMNMFTMSLEWFEIQLNYLYFVLACVISAFIVYKQRSVASTTKTVRVLCVIIFTTVVIATYTVFYILCTNVASDTITTVQFRYFLPIVLLTPICFLSSPQKPIKKVQYNRSVLVFYVTAFMIFYNIYALASVFCTHI